MASRKSLVASAVLLTALLSGCAGDTGEAAKADGSSSSASSPSTSSATSPASPATGAPSTSPTSPTSPTSRGSAEETRTWPPEARAVHGGQYWAVYLAVSRGDTEYDEVERAYRSAQAVGYEAGIGDICATGAHEALGLDPAVSYTASSIYFDTRAQAQQFVDMYEPGVVGTAHITAYCLD
jgi:ABC-type transport system substrate-binding protein